MEPFTHVIVYNIKSGYILSQKKSFSKPNKWLPALKYWKERVLHSKTWIPLTKKGRAPETKIYHSPSKNVPGQFSRVHWHIWRCTIIWGSHLNSSSEIVCETYRSVHCRGSYTAFPLPFLYWACTKTAKWSPAVFFSIFLAIVMDKYGMDDDSRLPASFSCALFSTDVFHSLCWGFLTRIVISHITANKRRTEEKKKSRAGSNSVLTMRAVNQQWQKIVLGLTAAIIRGETERR